MVCANLVLFSRKQVIELIDYFNTKLLASCNVTLEGGRTIVARENL